MCPRGAYDGNGNLKSDSYKGISTITYNHLNLPKLITFSSGNTIEIIYDAAGNKLRKIVKQGATVQYEQDYSGGIEYRKTPAAGTFRIEAIYHEEGRYFNLNVDASNTPSWRKEYALRDHLGSTRLMFADKDGDGMVEVTSNASTNEILQENHYYPFGLSYGGSHWMNDAARDNGYKYNGKELNEDWGLGWYDYGARWYMPDVGKFSSIDRFAEKYGYQSPFAYAGDSPINFIDVNGDSIGVNLLNSTSKKAFNAFFATNEGKAFIGQFAAKGQIINGYTFTADGQYHRKGIDLTYSDRNFGKGKEHNGAKTTGGNKGGTIVDGRLKLGVSINTTAEESSLIGKVTAITHESFLHVQEYSFDYSDNKKFDFSHDPFYMKTKDNSPDSRHHLMFHHKANASTTHPLAIKGIRVLESVNSRNNLGYTRTQLWEKIWEFWD